MSQTTRVVTIHCLFVVEIAKETFWKDDIAKSDPTTTEMMIRDTMRASAIGTKTNYASCLKDYWGYCLEHGHAPFKVPINPKIAIFWQFDRVRRLGSCNSHSTWSACLSWWEQQHHLKNTFFNDQFYRKMHRTMIKLYSKKRKPRFPVLLRWISQFIKHLNVSPSTWKSVKLDKFMVAFLFVMVFFTISRPSEILFTDKTEDEMIEIITTGLRWIDVQILDSNKEYIYRCMQIKINHYKNQEFRNEPKVIFMAPPICENADCHCHSLDFFAMFHILKQRRRKLVNSLRFKLNNTTLSKTERAKLIQRINKLDVSPMNFIFVGENGVIWRPSKLTDLMKEFTAFINMPNKECYPPYSLRIGATSLCYQQEVDMLKILRYVVWSIKKLPHVSNRYIEFTRYDLMILPFEMIHGKNRDGGNIDKSGGVLQTFNPWQDNSIEQLFCSN